MSLNFCILASGSSGNCSVIWNDKTVILIDCGCSANYIIEGLEKLKLNPKKITAVVITHAHTDHISASGINFLIKYNIPVYLHEDTLEDIFQKYGNKIDKCFTLSFNDIFKIKDIEVTPFDVHHKDSYVSRTLGFTFNTTVKGREFKIGYITDTGKVCKNIIKNLINSNILVIESNYDMEMLNESRRPRENKRWVLSDKGHLSNEDAANAIAEIKINSSAKDSLKHVFLAHLSYHHNTPGHALSTAKRVLLKYDICDINVYAAKRKQRCPTIKIS